MQKKNTFYAMLARMKYIKRWALMRNAEEENISEHSLEVAILSHALAFIGNTRLSKDLNADRIAMLGVYHDCTEIITGDMPTPIKYENPTMPEAYFVDTQGQLFNLKIGERVGLEGYRLGKLDKRELIFDDICGRQVSQSVRF